MWDYWHAIHEHTFLMANYDLIAPIYDPLSRLVFGRAQLKAQRDLLHFIKPGSKVLIVGGGTGWLLDDLASMEGLDIVFVESSAKMLTRARNRKVTGVDFVESPIEAFQTDEIFDVIQTGFLFDNFEQDQALKAFEALDQLLKPGGTWLFVEFQDKLWWQRGLIMVMYGFFRLVSGLRVSKLVDMEPIFSSKGYQVVQKSTYFGGSIVSIAYKSPA
jgi:ubiquinone/menaquinone biosynthesis C-methylase UbiE